MNLSHVLSYFLARAVPGLVSFAAIAVYSRLLDPASYGEYALALVWVSVLGTCLFQWIRSGLVRYYTENAANEHYFLSAIAAIYMALLAVLVALGLASWLLLKEGIGSQLVVLVVVVVGAQGLYDICVELKNAKLQPYGYGALASTKAILGLLFGWGLIEFMGLGSGAPLLGIAIAALAAVVFFGRAFWACAMSPRIDRRLSTSLLTFGLPLSLATLLNVAIHGGDRILIGLYLGTSEVGVYSAGFDIAQQSLGVLMSVLNLAFVPAIFQSYERFGLLAGREHAKQYGLIFIAVLLPSTVGMALLSENIASVFLGSSFSAQAASLIPIVAAGVLISGVKAFYFDVAFLLGKRTRDLIAIAGIAAIANILLNVLWIPANGILGAAYASAVSYAIGLGFSVAWGSKVFYLDRWDSELAKVVGATICLAVYLLLVATYRGPLALLGQVALGSLLYGGVLALLRYKAFRGQHLISQ